MTSAKRKAAPKPKAETVIFAYKGFDKDLRCLDFQYEIGKTYTHKGRVAACESGFHACEYPLSVFTHYGFTDGNRFAVVEQSGKIVKRDDKQVSRKITVKAEIGLPGLVKAAIEWTRKAATTPTSGYSAHSATSGHSAHSATSGHFANSATSGYSANSATSGNCANSATSGYSAHSATSGYCANSATSGYSTRAEARGKNGVAAIAGSGIALAGEGGAIFLVERGDDLSILAVFASKVGDHGIKADTWYALRDGKPVEVTP
jgi:hypothetical protein